MMKDWDGFDIVAISRAILTAAVLSLAVPSNAQPTIEDRESLDSLVDGYVERGIFPMLYVRVEDRDGNVVYDHGVNNPALVPGDPVNGETWLRIWSMSKIVTISAALDMIEDGLLAFDDPVAKFIPEFSDLVVAVAPNGASLTDLEPGGIGAEDPDAGSQTSPCPYDTVPAAKPMTVRDLLNHSAGFYYGVTQVPCINEAIGARAIAQAEDSGDLISRMAALPLIQQPGERYFYGTNTTVLGLVMERAEGKSLPAIVSDRITGPLGIENLRYGLPNGAVLGPRFIGDDGGLRVADPAELDIFASPPPGYAPESQLYLGGEGMVATTAAYADFLRMLLGRGQANGVRILDEMTIEALTSPHTQLDSKWGYNGWNLWVNSGLLSSGEQGIGNLWIGGGYEGTAFWVDHERGLVGLINTQVHRAPEGGGLAVETIREAIYARLIQGD